MHLLNIEIVFSPWEKEKSQFSHKFVKITFLAYNDSQTLHGLTLGPLLLIHHHSRTLDLQDSVLPARFLKVINYVGKYLLFSSRPKYSILSCVI